MEAIQGMVQRTYWSLFKWAQASHDNQSSGKDPGRADSSNSPPQYQRHRRGCCTTQGATDLEQEDGKNEDILGQKKGVGLSEYQLE
jgi:hypothetical protein